MHDWNIVNCDVKQPIHLTSPLFDRLKDPSIIRSAPMRPRMDCIRMVPYLRYTCPMTCKRYIHLSIHDSRLVAGLFCGFTSLLAIFHSNRDLEAWDYQSLKLKRRDQKSNPDLLVCKPSAKPLHHHCSGHDSWSHVLKNNCTSVFIWALSSHITLKYCRLWC